MIGEMIVKEIHEGQGDFATKSVMRALKSDLQELKTGVKWLKFLYTVQIIVTVFATIIIIYVLK